MIFALGQKFGVMTEVPLISITQDANIFDDPDDESSPRLNINECHTDVEDFDSDQSPNRSIKSLKASTKCNGAVTDVEDFGDSNDDFDESEKDYGPEVSLNEYLDMGCVDESSAVAGGVKGKLESMHSVARRPSPSAFNLGVYHDVGGVTDCEDLEDSGDENDENEKVYSEDDQPIVLEGSNAVDIHDSVGARKRVEKVSSKMAPLSSDSSSSSDDDEPKLRLKSHKHFVKRSQKIGEAKSDVESIFVSDDDKKKKKKYRRSPMVLETPDIEFMAFEGSDVEEVQHFPEINISFVEEPKPKKKTKHRSTPAPSLMLKLPENQDEGHTDVENLNSSDDEDDQCMKMKPKFTIPIAVIKSDALTDVEDYDDSGDDCELDEKPDLPLPSPVREITIFVENKNGEPTIETVPLPDNVLLGFLDLDLDKGLTDVEDFSDEYDDDERDSPVNEIECILDLDGGVVESSDHSTAKVSPSPRASLAAGVVTPEPLTDTEDIFLKRNDKGAECRRRRTKPKHSQHKPKSLFLDTKFYVDSNAAGSHTDVEDLDVDDDDILLKDKSLNRRRATVNDERRKSSVSSNVDGKTDIEDVSGDDTLDLTKVTPEIKMNDVYFDSCTMTRFRESSGPNRGAMLELNLPEIRKLSPTPEGRRASTDVEDIQYNSEAEEISYSRAQTATPFELNRDLEELCTSEIHEINSGAFDRVREQFEMKENLCNVESHTDVENFDGDEN